MAGGLGLVYKRNFTEFLKFTNLKIMFHRLGFGFPVFQTCHDFMMPCKFLVEFRETGSHSRTCGNCHESTFGSGHIKNIYVSSSSLSLNFTFRKHYFSFKTFHRLLKLNNIYYIVIHTFSYNSLTTQIYRR